MGFHFNAPRCTGCKTCALACKDYNDLSETIAYRQVYEVGCGTWTQDANGCWSTDTQVYYLSLACNHCDAPICVQVCPTGAMHKGDGGLVSVDTDRCIGCGYCQLSCPYHAPHVDRARGHSRKCDGCAVRLEAGKKPICVEACPLRAIDFGPIEELRQRYGQVASVGRLPDASVTRPNLVLTPPANVDEQGMLPAGAGDVLNPQDIV